MSVNEPKSGSPVLVVDDDPGVLMNLQRILDGMRTTDDMQAFFADSLDSAMDRLCEQEVSVVLLDKNFLNGGGRPQTGIDSIPQMLSIRPHCQIIIYSGSKDTQDVVQAMRLGAAGYVNKADSEELLTAQIRKAVDVSVLSNRKAQLERQRPGTADGALVFASRAMKQIRAKIPALAESDRPVLLLGETGTGKTAIGKLIHATRCGLLGTKEENFQYFNIRQFQSNVIESELFGHEAGAFTGATSRKLGFCELAHNGTLFIDEIGEAPLDVQAKLLTVLSEGVFHRVGGPKPIRSSFKLLCATNRNLEKMVEEGTFREDLYYRICALEVRIPSLVERREDTPDLVRHLVPIMSAKNRVSVTFDELPTDYVKYLCDFPPRGNIRGLENSLTRLMVNSPKDTMGRCVFTDWQGIQNGNDTDRRALARRKILTVEDLMELPFDLGQNEFPGLDAVLEAVENKIVTAVYEKVGKGNEVARYLKRSRSNVSVRYRAIVGRREKQSGGRKPNERAFPQ
jgi:two-component system, NtrC family, response regulator